MFHRHETFVEFTKKRDRVSLVEVKPHHGFFECISEGHVIQLRTLARIQHEVHAFFV